MTTGNSKTVDIKNDILSARGHPFSAYLIFSEKQNISYILMLVFVKNFANFLNRWALRDTVEDNVSEVFLLTFTKSLRGINEKYEKEEVFRKINDSLEKRNTQGNSANFNMESFYQIKSHGKPQMFNVFKRDSATKEK